MHNFLEAYLGKVAAHLSALPPKRRMEELREMRTHLENAIIVGREMGQTEEEAAREAVAQFGTSGELGENLVWAWRRERARDQKSLWGSAGSFLFVICLHFWLMNQNFYGNYWPDALLLYCGRHQNFGRALTEATFLLGFAMAGVVSGAFFPRRAIPGACLGLLLFFVGVTAADGLGMVFGWNRAGWALTALVSAWAVSRLRIGGPRWEYWGAK